MSLPQIRFNPTKERRLAQGYLWAFRNELNFRQKDFPPGSLVRLESSKGRPLAVGFLNSRSNLSFRALALAGELENETQLEPLLRARIASAFESRPPSWEGKRLIFSEGDYLSGLVVDQYRDVLVLQISSAGMERFRNLIVEELRRLSACRAIVERSDSKAREKEGLEPSTGLLWGATGLKEASLKTVSFQEGDLTFEADLLEGQKTGFFLDQRPSRRLLREIAEGRHCLDIFCNSGGLSLAMARAGAASVLGIDESESALAIAKRQAAANGLSVRFEKAEAFTWLRQKALEGPGYDLIALDPPNMAPGPKQLGDALRGYKELNLRALKLLRPGGLLLSCSCTQAVDEKSFLSTIQSAAVDAGVKLRERLRLGQAEDHPRHPAMPETNYLKIFLFQKI